MKKSYQNIMWNVIRLRLKLLESQIKTWIWKFWDFFDIYTIRIFIDYFYLITYWLYIHTIVRKSVDYDDRLKQITLTDKGRDIMFAMWDNIIKSDIKLIQGIDKEKLDIFYEVLDQVKANAEKEVMWNI